MDCAHTHYSSRRQGEQSIEEQLAEDIPDTPEGIILEAVIEGMAAYYSEQLSQNVRRGMKTSAQKGRYTGGTCPLGYRITTDKRYEIDPKHAPTVREIFHLYAEGKTVTEIITILNNRGLRTARGQLFTHNSLRTLLKNKKYIGTLVFFVDAMRCCPYNG